MEDFAVWVKFMEVNMTKINIYLQDGRVFSYDVVDPIKAREHAHRIVTLGWRNVVNGMMEYYPIHQVLKVTFAEPEDLMAQKYETK
jgi:hypothetical protein